MKDYFEEIVGYEDIKRELRIISDMLNNTDIYKKMGAISGKGLVLVGEPGTGKTTMANCLIKSTNRKSYVCRKKTSDGAFIKQLADMFDLAKINAPSIILLDDLDKFSDEDEDRDAEEFVTVQTCIDEVADMDVFVIATVNNIHKIPRSLLRHGRIGKRINVHVPKNDEAEAIVRHYLDKAKISDGLDEVSIARMLNNETCATLESVIGCAAIKAAYKRQENVTMENIVDACLDLVFEAPESSNHLSEDTLRKNAYHEAAHAVVSEILDPGSVSIVSIRETSGGDYGFVRYYRSDEQMDTDATFFENTIKTSLAGKAITELVFGETDLGANGDLHNAFDRAERLADNFCMFGFNNWMQDDYSHEWAAENRNRAVAMIVEKNYLEVKKLLVKHRGLLDLMAHELLEKSTLLYSDVQRICASAS
jgi:cell division protease FtsH